MPAKNSIKVYAENTYYHVYNRGVNKQKIFESGDDFQKFLYYLEIYLSKPDLLRQKEPLLKIHLVNNNLFGKIEILAFCLMPNHFHLLVKQIAKDAVTKLMRQVSTSYSMYFNRKYERVGPLFQGKFKAVTVETDEQLLHLGRYIHQNPLSRGVSLDDFEWSSYQAYLGKIQIPWLSTETILEYFNKANPNSSYRNFVEDHDTIPPQIQNITLED